jgi:hypothetical protein
MIGVGSYLLQVIDIKNAIFAEKYTAATDDVLDEIIKEMDFDGAVINWAQNNQSKFIGKIVISNY